MLAPEFRNPYVTLGPLAETLISEMRMCKAPTLPTEMARMCLTTGIGNYRIIVKL